MFLRVGYLLRFKSQIRNKGGIRTNNFGFEFLSLTYIYTKFKSLYWIFVSSFARK